LFAHSSFCRDIHCTVMAASADAVVCESKARPSHPMAAANVVDGTPVSPAATAVDARSHLSTHALGAASTRMAPALKLGGKGYGTGRTQHCSPHAQRCTLDLSISNGVPALSPHALGQYRFCGCCGFRCTRSSLWKCFECQCMCCLGCVWPVEIAGGDTQRCIWVCTACYENCSAVPRARAAAAAPY
jgi:hypothetical protein